MLLLIESPNYVEVLNSALAGTGTVISAGDGHRPICAVDDMEYELPKFSREYLDLPLDVLGRRLQCSVRGSLLISAAALPATPPAQGRHSHVIVAV